MKITKPYNNKSLTFLLLLYLLAISAFATSAKSSNSEKGTSKFVVVEELKIKKVSDAPFYTTQNIGTNPSKQALSAPYNSAQNVNPVLGLILVVAFIVFGIYVAARVRRLLKEEKH